MAGSVLDRANVDAVLNDLDEYAIEEALKIVEANGEGHTVTLISMGPERATEALRKGLSMGADDAILISDPALAGADALVERRRRADGHLGARDDPLRAHHRQAGLLRAVGHRAGDQDPAPAPRRERRVHPDVQGRGADCPRLRSPEPGAGARCRRGERPALPGDGAGGWLDTSAQNA